MDAVALNLVVSDAAAAKPITSSALAPWPKRVRWVGGLIQAAFAAFWLVRGSVVIGGRAADLLLIIFGLSAIGVFTYAIKAATGTAARPSTPDGRRIERQVTIATVVEFVAAIILPVLVSAAGHSDWVLPSIAITVGPLLLWLDHRVSLPRYRPVGWALTVGPVILVATMSGTTLVATTGIGGGMLLLGTALTGFRELAAVRRLTQPSGLENLVASAGVQL